MVKPRIPAGCMPLLLEIDDYIRRYDVRDYLLANAASDVLDGWMTRAELEPLVRRRLLTVITYGYTPNGDGLCGWGYTVHLTKRAMLALWPDRAAGVNPSDGGQKK